jgi:hypothetical protein
MPDNPPPTRESAMMRGIPVDSLGGPTIDPTKNVLDLVEAQNKYHEAMRLALEKTLNNEIGSLKELFKTISDNVSSFQNAQVASETRRIDQLAVTRQEYQNTIRDMLAESVRTTSQLVSTQLVQIQATFDTRVSKLEAGAFTQAGKQSVTDPAISDSISRMMQGLTTLRTDTDDRMAKMARDNIEQLSRLTQVIDVIGKQGNKAESTRMGQGQIIGWIVGAAMLMAAIATPLISFLAMRGK